MKKSLKALTALLLCLIMAALPLSAAASAEVTPVIIVSGMGALPLYMNTDSGSVQVFPPSSESIISAVKKSLAPLAESFIKGDSAVFTEACVKAVFQDVFEPISMNPDGTSVNDVYAPTFPQSIDNYSGLYGGEPGEDEIGLRQQIGGSIGAENTYFFYYDWRMSPLDHAEDLNGYIEKVKADKGCDKVTLVCASMGGTIVNSYLYKYGSESVKKLIYCCVASSGVNLVGELFNGSLEITVDALLERLFNFQMDDILTQTLISVLHTGLEMTPAVTAAVDRFVAAFIEENEQILYDELVMPTFASMPGIWALVPREYYEDNKQNIFGGEQTELTAMIDEYHYNVLEKSVELMQSAADSGCELYIIAGYGFVGFPVTSAVYQQSDCLIETSLASFGAVTAPYGQPFSSDYQPAGTVCSDPSHNHVSTDGIVDASSCAFPEQTWFIKNNRHVGLPAETQAGELVSLLVCSEEQLTVHSDSRFSQFSSLNLSTGELESLTGDEIKPDVLDSKSNIIVRILTFLKSLWSIIKGYFSALAI